MLFGSKETFAIEAEVLEIHGEWTYGHLVFWIASRPVGDANDVADLATSARWGRVFLSASTRRTRGDLDQRSTAEVYDQLYGRFVTPASAPSSKGWELRWDRDPYVLDEVGDSSVRDNFAILVVRRVDRFDRVVVNSFDGPGLWESLVSPGVCDSVIEQYCAWVEGQRGSPLVPPANAKDDP